MRDNGGSAFPSPSHQFKEDGRILWDIKAPQGMTILDYFAAKAMQALVTESSKEEAVAEWAYRQAAAMLKEKERYDTREDE